MKDDITRRLLNQAQRTIDQYNLLEKGDRIVVGVSGGIDSMVLIHILHVFSHKFDLSLIVAHVNHGLRPEESLQEASLVKKESERLGLQFEYEEVNVKAFKKSTGFSLQDAARRLRFQFFEKLLLKYNANKIALGHNADDQVETIILRILRGSGLRGLKGMLPVRDGKIIRPLLEIWRKDIESFANENKIPFLLDSSNLKEDYLRNRIRLSLIPLIENQYQSKFKEILLRTANLLRQEDNYIDSKAAEVYQNLIQKHDDSISFLFSKYQSLHRVIQWRVINKILSEILEEEKIVKRFPNLQPIFERLNKSSSNLLFQVIPGIYLEKRYDRVVIRKGVLEETPHFEIEVNFPGKTTIKEIGRELIIEEIPKINKLSNYLPTIAFFDYESIQFPLKVRNFRPGDKFQPLGLKGFQKLKKFFIDHKVPKIERSRIPLLISGDIIAWVVGYRIDERVKIKPETKRILRAEII